MQALPPPPPPPAIEAPALDRSQATTGDLRVAAALTDARIHVDSSFSGASIVLYGAVFNPTDDPADVVVVVRGPEAPIRLVKKTRNMGVWLNSRPVLFEGAPGFYMTASTRPLSEIADFGQLRRLGVGVDHLRIDAPEESRTVTRYGVRDVVISRLGEDYLDWRRAVIRLVEPPRRHHVEVLGHDDGRLQPAVVAGDRLAQLEAVLEQAVGEVQQSELPHPHLIAGVARLLRPHLRGLRGLHPRDAGLAVGEQKVVDLYPLTRPLCDGHRRAVLHVIGVGDDGKDGVFGGEL